MQVTKFPIVALMTAVVLASLGCESIDRRINTHHAAYASLTPADQDRIVQGDIRKGDSAELVTIAFGKPDSQSAITTSSGKQREVWIYTKTHHVKESSRVAHDGEGPQGAVFEDVYRVFKELEREITLLDGAVVYVRDPQRDAQLVAATLAR